MLRTIRRRSLAKLRHEVEPVEPAVLGRLRRRRGRASSGAAHGLDALLDAIEQLQGAPLPASILETEILPARIDGYEPADLDALTRGRRSRLGRRRAARRARRPRRALPHRPPVAAAAVRRRRAELSATREAAILDSPRGRTARRSSPRCTRRPAAAIPARRSTRCGIWSGRASITNDTFHALRAFTRPPARRPRKPARPRAVPRRARRAAVGGRTLVAASPIAWRSAATDTQWATAMAQQLLARHGVLTREAAAVGRHRRRLQRRLRVLKALEDAGRIRRGYFVAGLGATQFALPPALDLLRSLRETPEERRERSSLAATDPAESVRRDAEVAGRRAGEQSTQAAARHAPSARWSSSSTARSAAYVPRGGRQLVVWLPDDEPADRRSARALARRARRARPRRGSRRPARRRDQRRAAGDASVWRRSSSRPASIRPRWVSRCDARPPRVAPAGDARQRPLHAKPTCLKATRSFARRGRCIARSPATRSCASNRCCRR